jgi:hypothetical protein
MGEARQDRVETARQHARGAEKSQTGANAAHQPPLSALDTYVLGLQRTAGNAAVVEAIRAGDLAPPARSEAAPSAATRTVAIQRYQAGERGHGSIEAEALAGAGFEGTMTEGEIGSIYIGNWMRDFSQIGNPHSQPILDILNVLSWGEFNRPVDAQQVGGYLPSEHLDRPTTGVTKGDVGDASLATMDTKDQASLSNDQRLWVAQEQDPDFKKRIEKQAQGSGLPPYIEVGKEHAKLMLEKAARGRRGDQAVMASIGNGLHAVEDYFSHSNFVDAAVYMLVRDRQLPANSPIYQGILARGKHLGYDPSGGIARGAGRAQIFSGAYRSTGNKAVSMLEQLESEVKTGALRKAAILGALRMGWVKGGEAGEQALGTVGKYVAGGLSAPVGAVGGGLAGAGRGLVSGFRRGHGFFGKTWSAMKGLAGGGVEGAKSGAQAGWQKGGEVGQRALGGVGRVAGGAITAAVAGTLVAAVAALITAAIALAQAGAVVASGVGAVGGGIGGGVVGAGRGAATGWSKGHGIKKAWTGLEGLAGGGAEGARSGAARGWRAPGELPEALKDSETAKATKADAKAGDPLPNHSQLAKDDTEHPLFGVSRALAVVADREIGKAMIAAWSRPGDEAAISSVKRLVDYYVSHPADNDWWKDPVMRAATGHGVTGELTLPAAAAVPAAPLRERVPALH